MEDLHHMPRAAVFVVVVQEGSFSKAARKLGISKSVVSTHVRALEDALGVRLLERSSRSLHLTGAGEQFHGYATRMLEVWTEGRDQARAHAEEPRGTLRVTASCLLAGLIGPAVAQFVQAHPRIEVDVLFNDHFVNLLEEKIDVAIRVGPLEDSSLIACHLTTDCEIIVATPTLAKSWEGTTPEDLRFAPWIAHTPLRSPRSWTFHGPGGQRVELSVQPRVNVSTSEGLQALAACGTGFAVMPSFLVSAALQDGRLQRVLPAWSARAVPIQALYMSRHNPPAKTLRFVAALRDVFRGIA